MNIHIPILTKTLIFLMAYHCLFVSTANSAPPDPSLFEISKYNSDNKSLYLPNVEVENLGNYNAEMVLIETSPDLIFELRSAEKHSLQLNNTDYFSFDTRNLVIPKVYVFNEQWSAVLNQIEGADTIRFNVSNASLSPIEDKVYKIIETKDPEMPIVVKSILTGTYLGLIYDENNNYNGAAFSKKGIDRVDISFNPENSMLKDLTIADEKYIFFNYSPSTVDIIKIKLGEEMVFIPNIPLTDTIQIIPRKTPHSSTNKSQNNQEYARKFLKFGLKVLEKAITKGLKANDVVLDTLKTYSKGFRYQLLGKATSEEIATSTEITFNFVDAMRKKITCPTPAFFSSPIACTEYFYNYERYEREIAETG